MKKIIVSLGLTLVLLPILSFVNDFGKRNLSKDGTITLCSANVGETIEATSFVPDAQAGIKIRKNIDNLPPPDLQSLKAGITAMKALPYTDPTSWDYQAAIHGTLMPDNLANWNTCHKAGDEYFFLAWHRMYVYFFEQILRKKSGDPNLALPYWNYQINPALNSAYRDNTLGNPLYDGTRSPSINSGGSLPSSIMTSFANSLNNNIAYYSFQSALNGPHGSVHVAIGGNMRSVSTAAADPVFWLHHANIDRLWEEWLRKCKGRANPVDQRWLTKSYTFFDENGAAVSLKGSDVVSIATQLRYKYDVFPSEFVCAKVKRGLFAYKRTRLLNLPDPVSVKGKRAVASFDKARSENLIAFANANKNAKLNFKREEGPDKFIIEFNSIQVEKLPEGVIEVYLNLAPKEKPDPKSKSFVGLLDLFSVTHLTSHDEHPEVPFEINASETVRSLGLGLDDFRKASVSFFVRGNTLNGKEIETSNDLKIDVSFAIERATKIIGE